MATFTPAFELDLADLPFEFSEASYVSLGSGVYTPLSVEFSLDDFPFEFATGIYVSPGAGVFTARALDFSLDDIPFEFASGISRSFSPGVFQPKSIELGIDALQYSPLDHTVEIIIVNVDPPSLWLPKMIEVQFPTRPDPSSNRILFQVGTEEWRYAKDAAATVTQVVSTIRFIVDIDDVAAFLTNLDTNRASVFRLSLPGYFPFDVESSDNWVRVLGRTRPKRAERGDTYAVEVTFFFVATYP